MNRRSGLSSAERRSARRARAGGWLRPWPAHQALMITPGMTPVYGRGIGWLLRDSTGTLRDLCGPVHRP